MRRTIAFLLAAVFSISFAACGANNSVESSETDASTDSQTETSVAEESDIPVSEEPQAADEQDADSRPWKKPKNMERMYI